jgi:hypothetical protein
MTIGEELPEPRRALGHGVGRRNPRRVEAFSKRLGKEALL